MEKFNNVGRRIRLVLAKLGVVTFGLGILLTIVAVILSATPFQKSWILADILAKFVPIMVMGGLSTGLCFLGWIEFTASGPEIKLFSFLFNYLPILLVVGGGCVYLIGTYWVGGDTDLALNGLRLHFAGYLVLIIKFTYGFRYLNKLLSKPSDKSEEIGQ